MGRESRATWARRIRRWTQSGLTAEPFAPWESVNPRTLSFWRWKLRHAAPGGRGPAPAPAGAADEPVNAVSLLGVGTSRRVGARAHVRPAHERGHRVSRRTHLSRSLSRSRIRVGEVACTWTTTGCASRTRTGSTGVQLEAVASGGVKL